MSGLPVPGREAEVLAEESIPHPTPLTAHQKKLAHLRWLL